MFCVQENGIYVVLGFVVFQTDGRYHAEIDL